MGVLLMGTFTAICFTAEAVSSGIILCTILPGALVKPHLLEKNNKKVHSPTPETKIGDFSAILHNNQEKNHYQIK